MSPGVGPFFMPFCLQWFGKQSPLFLHRAHFTPPARPSDRVLNQQQLSREWAGFLPYGARLPHLLSTVLCRLFFCFPSNEGSSCSRVTPLLFSAAPRRPRHFRLLSVESPRLLSALGRDVALCPSPTPPLISSTVFLPSPQRIVSPAGGSILYERLPSFFPAANGAF